MWIELDWPAQASPFLSVLVRSGWEKPGKDLEAAEYELLLCAGGPAVRIRGDLDEHKERYSARLEIQDWGTPWVPYHQADENVLVAYAR